MSVRLIQPTPDKKAYFYHTSVNPDGSTNEHLFIGRLRANATHLFSYCHLCDAVTQHPQHNGGIDAQEIQHLIDSGALDIVAVPDVAPSEANGLDPLRMAREDGIGNIPAQVPQDAAARRELRRRLRDHHVNQPPDVNQPPA